MTFRFIPITALLVLLPTVSAAAPSAATSEPVDMTHRMMLLVIQLGLLLIAARIGSMLAARRNLPGVLGELLAGILIGPYLLGAIVLPGFPEGIFPVFSATFAVSPELYGICAIASIILLFSIGLETDARLLLRYSGPGLAIGLGGVITSFLGGNFAATIILPYLVPGTYTMMSPACLFLGIIASATSVGITARVLSDQRKLDTPEGMTILAGAVIDDVLGIILLAVGMGVIAASAAGEGAVQWGEIGRIAIKAIGIWLGATILGILSARRISAMLKKTRDQATIAILALGMALLLAGLFEEARLAMIIGAYVMGLALSRTDISLVIQDFLHPVQKLLVPVFFAVMGMLVDVRLLLTPRVFLAGLAFLTVANLVKVIGCGAPSLLFGFNLRGALRIGTGMMPRGEVALIMAGIALSSGMLPSEAFSIVILTTLLTTLSVPPLISALFRHPGSGRRIPEPPTQTAALAFRFPSPDTADLLTAKLRVAFEGEGFFVHLVDHASQLYRVLKDDIAIRFQCVGDTIHFSCDETQRIFISTAMLEVLAEFERTVAELRKPIDAAAILPASSHANPIATHGAQLAAALRTELCIPALKAHTKDEVIRELLDRIASIGMLTDPAQALADICNREAMMSTGMQDGVAIPHARTNAVTQLTCAIGLKPAGLDFGALDGKPSTIFVMTLSPREGTTPHIQFMAGISRFLSDPQNRETLLEQQTGSGILRLLQGKPPAESNRLPRWSPATLLARFRPDKYRSMRETLRQHLRPELCCHNLAATDAQGILRALLQRIVEAKLLTDPEPLLAGLLQREADISTALEHGIAVPHLRTNTLQELVCCIGIHRQGIPFGARDGALSHIFILTLSPESKPVPHIQFMATLTHGLDPRTRRQCLKTDSDAALYHLLAH